MPPDCPDRASTLARADGFVLLGAIVQCQRMAPPDDINAEIGGPGRMSAGDGGVCAGSHDWPRR